MTQRRVLFVHEDKELPQVLEKELDRVPSWVVSFEPFGRPTKSSDNHHYDLVVLESKRGWIGALQQGHPPQVTASGCPVLAIPPGILKKNSRRLIEALQTLLEDAERPSSRTSPRPLSRVIPRDPLLEDFVERKLKEFVKKIKASQSGNLYTLLLKEIERPLITLTLKETNGNQIQAALILGMNRNTLRKKIKELKIPLKRN